MKITNLLKYLREKFAEAHRQGTFHETERIVNTDVYIANDKNDPENKIYVYVNGVPVALVCDIVRDGENCVLINQVCEYVSNIKKMYRNKINGNKVI